MVEMCGEGSVGVGARSSVTRRARSMIDWTDASIDSGLAPRPNDFVPLRLDARLIEAAILFQHDTSGWGKH